MFFQFLSTKKVNLVAKTMQSAYLCFIFHVKPKKLPFLAVLTWFIILGKIQDGDYCWWRQKPPATPPPIKYTSSCYEDQRLSTKGKIVSKYCNILKTPGRVSIHLPPRAPCTTVGEWICVYVQGLIRLQLRLSTLSHYNVNRKTRRIGHGVSYMFFSLWKIVEMAKKLLIISLLSSKESIVVVNENCLKSLLSPLLSSHKLRPEIKFSKFLGFSSSE